MRGLIRILASVDQGLTSPIGASPQFVDDLTPGIRRMMGGDDRVAARQRSTALYEAAVDDVLRRMRDEADRRIEAYLYRVHLKPSNSPPGWGSVAIRARAGRRVCSPIRISVSASRLTTCWSSEWAGSCRTNSSGASRGWGEGTDCDSEDRDVL